MENKQVFSKKKKFFFHTVMVLLLFAVFALAYMSYAAYKTVHIYQNIKAKQRGWIGNVHAVDAELGYAPVPNSQGAHAFPIGPDIPMRYDEDGFRVPMEVGASSHPRPLFLELGCSFTYGDAAYAKDTYPYLVGLSLNGTSKNAGVCSYGLSQMLPLAKKLVPIHKPDYLLVQYSKWLVDRAQNPFAPSYFGKLPTPFFYEEDHSFALYPPVFLTKILDLPVSLYRNTPNNWIDAVSFYWNVGLPLSAHDDFNMLKYITYRIIGIIPPPTNSREELIEYVYKEINNVAEEYGVKVVIVVIGDNATPVEVKEQLFPSGALLVNAHDALLRRLSKINTENYLKEYAHWRGSPPRVVDTHPNDAAHSIIAGAIVSAITQAEMK
tara:strand:+ start:171 stop:1310 length:1140 start_codon:yes stop_codon:yes gene_type:complete